VLNAFFGQLQNSSGALKGIIIDVRNNPGGEIEDLNFLAGKLVGAPLLFGYSRYKSGDGRLAYTPWIQADVVPPEANKAVTIPITVLADNYSVSLAELFAMVIHTLPNGKVVGETTWGATGPLTDNVVYNDGQFDVGSFLSVYTSSAGFKYADGRRYEGKGFPPDVAVPFDPAALSAGHDPCLEKAL
jgi:C-terminal processing protease CtpA/Prc